MEMNNTPAAESTDAGQAAIERLKKVSAMVLALRPADSPFTLFSVRLQTDPVKLERRLKATKAGSIMLADGETLGIDDPSGYYQPLSLNAGEVEPFTARVVATNNEYSDGSWSCSLETSLGYGRGEETASQTITLTATTASRQPHISRKLGSVAYAETGYEGHGFVDMKDATPADAHEVLDIVEPHIGETIDVTLGRLQAVVDQLTEVRKA